MGEFNRGDIGVTQVDEVKGEVKGLDEIDVSCIVERGLERLELKFKLTLFIVKAQIGSCIDEAGVRDGLVAGQGRFQGVYGFVGVVFGEPILREQGIVNGVDGEGAGEEVAGAFIHRKLK